MERFVLKIKTICGVITRYDYTDKRTASKAFWREVAREAINRMDGIHAIDTIVVIDEEGFTILKDDFVTTYERVKA